MMVTAVTDPIIKSVVYIGDGEDILSLSKKLLEKEIGAEWVRPVIYIPQGLETYEDIANWIKHTKLDMQAV